MTLDARAVVQRAAEGNHSASEWLRLDERGYWERQAAEMIERTAAQRLEEKIDDAAALAELGDRLRLYALRALIADARGRAKGG